MKAIIFMAAIIAWGLLIIGILRFFRNAKIDWMPDIKDVETEGK